MVYLKKIERRLIARFLGIKDLSKLYKTTLICGDPKRIFKFTQFMEESEKLGEIREKLLYSGTYKGVPLTVVATGMGAPNVALVTEVLARLGVKTIIRVGTCGALQKNIEIGDFVIPTGAIRGDGVSKEYVSRDFPAVADFGVVHALVKASKEIGEKPHLGVIWSHDALFTETRDRISELERIGVKAVEMECSALFVLGLLKGVRTGAILAVDGNLPKGKQFHAYLTESSRRAFDKRIETEIKIALEAATTLSEVMGE